MLCSRITAYLQAYLRRGRDENHVVDTNNHFRQRESYRMGQAFVEELLKTVWGFYNYSKHFFHQNGTYIKYFHYLCKKNKKERNHSSWNNLKEYHTEYLISSILSSETSIMSIRLCICLCWKKRQTLSSLYVLEDSERVC